jgi:hypothetical protein
VGGREKGFIGKDGMLVSNPRSSDWRSALVDIRTQHGLAEDSLQAGRSAIAEELNVLYAGA